jgi:mono/diheme cytochrome c family protein
MFAAFAATLALAGISGWFFLHRAPRANPDDVAQVARGRQVYAAQCAACHGANLQGEANWKERKASGRLPAPPHDASGHTWHHADDQLFAIVKQGLTPFVPAGYQTDMPAFETVLSDDEIWAVLAFIKHSWPPEIRQSQRGISEQAEN